MPVLRKLCEITHVTYNTTLSGAIFYVLANHGE